MGRGIGGHATSLRPQHPVQNRHSAALAIGPCDSNDLPQTGMVNVQPIQHQAYAAKPHINDLTMLATDVIQPALKGIWLHSCSASTEGCSGAVTVSVGAGRCISLARILAMRLRSSLRWIIMSITPCSNRNSLRWKPSGSFSRTVCSITRGPAKPISALGSARFKSPNIARLAETPPNTGSVNTDRYGSPSRRIRSKAAAVLAICIRENSASCMRAPPLARSEEHTSELQSRPHLVCRLLP